MKKAVFIRLDKIGDLICTMPVDEIEYLQDWEITWIIAKGLSFVPEHAVPKRTYLEIDKGRPAEARQILNKFLKDYKPDVAVCFQAPWWVHFSIWKARIKTRIGVLSKWDSFLFLNKGLRQRRSHAVKHEAEYNLDLVRQIDPERISDSKAPVLKLQADKHDSVLNSEGLESQKYSVVHPGMAGSALNWPTEYYIELIAKLSLRRKVVLTGTLADEPWLKEIKSYFAGNTQIICLQNKLTSNQLLSVLQQAHSVFAPSTGVLHLAASLGAPVYGLM
jgi:ADP-heptose:LPS heptosyltransferase